MSLLGLDDENPQTGIWVGIRFVRITSNKSNLIQNRRDKIHVYFSGVYL